MRKFALLCCLPLFACATTESVPVPPPAPAGAGASHPVRALHQVKRVKVADGVELEVLDFGGQGPALVFLSGLGDTGHVFDDFAPELTAKHRVYSVTRRGFGSSSWPEGGYDTETLGADVVRVLDGLGIAKASLAGHSIAGLEITWLATHHPDRVEKVIYLDVKTDGDLVAEMLKVMPPPPPREPDPADLASRAAVAAAISRGVGGPWPEHEIDETVEFDPKTGRYLRDRGRPDAAMDARRGMAKVDYAAVRAPVLFIYVDHPPPPRAEEWRDFAVATPTQQDKLRAMLIRMRERYAEVESWAKLPNWRHVKLEHGDHYVWITNRDEVLREMKGFLER
ncbi:alpha/beta fold hydrolase [Polyangium aurulentum]|uniref:alpha/beta fold hydrolase n=1 Tax=Polyangium aurulentum TaxID=2567896 RepID=UPI001F204C74|nr:alpha/beta hydrolase [Polyangium aurulentum]